MEIAIVAVEIVAPEVVGDVEIGISIVVVVFPGRGKAEAPVVGVEA